MGSCGSCGPAGGGPFSEGVELVEFVYNAHDGGVRNAPIPDGGLNAKCQGCGESEVALAVSGRERSHLSLVTSDARDLVGLTNEEIVSNAVRSVAAVLPRAHAGRVLRGSVVREKRAPFSLAPGQPARPGTVTAVAGLLLAGDWIDTGLPGTIESAVVSGHRAAERVLGA